MDNWRMVEEALKKHQSDRVNMFKECLDEVVNCHNCGKKLKINLLNKHKKFRCPVCKKIFNLTDTK